MGQTLLVVLTVVWLCGVLVVLLVWCVRLRQVHATLRRAVPVDAGREVEILRRMESGRVRTDGFRCRGI